LSAIAFAFNMLPDGQALYASSREAALVASKNGKYVQVDDGSRGGKVTCASKNEQSFSGHGTES
jgi:hypothetical protein